MKIVIASILLLASASPLAAQTVAATPAVVTVVPPVATQVAGKLFPVGTYRKLLGDTLGKMMTGMIDQMGDMPIAEIVKAAGIEQSNVAKLDKASVNQIMAIVDPAYKERMRLTTDSMFKAMIPLFEQMEPDLRLGLAESLTNRFTVQQLGELNTFFDTPTGSSFASQQMLLFMDPAVIGRMQAQMPKMIKAMPELVGGAIKATANLPKPKKYADLTEADKAELSKLLGIDASKMSK
jgi:hypothetical protein